MRHDLQILEAVVGFDAIFVMNILAGQERPAEMELNHMAMS